MTKPKKFRKSNWWDDEVEVVSERRDPKKKRFDRALRTMDVDYFNDEDDY